MTGRGTKGKNRIVNREARDRLAACLLCWMKREVGSFWLDEQMTGDGLWFPEPREDGYDGCWMIVWCTYDDFTDHVFESHAPSAWNTLLRTLAFLRSDLEVARIAKRRWFRLPQDDDPVWTCQPFLSAEDWEAHKRLVAEELNWPVPEPVSRSIAKRMANALSTPDSEASGAAGHDPPKHRSFRLTKY